MLTTNNLFFKSVSETLLKSNQIDKTLIRILEKGILDINGLILFSEFYNIRTIPSEVLFDDIDKEVFINSFHSDDYLNNSHTIYDHWVNMVLFCNLLPDYLPENRDYSVCIILSQTEFGVNFKMYKDRKIEYLSEDLDQYHQNIMKITF